MSNIKSILLAAGLGTRLKPLTDYWPKCLMPIGEIPLLAYWLEYMKWMEMESVLVNLHYHADIVQEFLEQPVYKNFVQTIFEPELLGTAGTIRANRKFIEDSTLLLVHADNWSYCDWSKFVSFHKNRRPQQCVITMMTFESDQPSSCGILELDEQGVVVKMHEKVENPPSNLANAAVYLIEPEVVDWICERPYLSDFSTEVIPHFMGRISTWHNGNIHRDIGTPESLSKAQNDPKPIFELNFEGKWKINFLEIYRPKLTNDLNHLDK